MHDIKLRNFIILASVYGPEAKLLCPVTRGGLNEARTGSNMLGVHRNLPQESIGGSGVSVGGLKLTLDGLHPHP
jgi:hypothetical protein